MNDDGERPPSIRRRLMVFLIGSLLLMVAGAAIVTYSVAWRSANDAYDRSLLDPAFDIADNVSVDAHGAHVDLPQKALEALVYDQTDKVIYQVRTPGDVIIDGVADLPPPPPFAPDQFNSSTPRTAAKRSASPRCARRTASSCRSGKRCTSAHAWSGRFSSLNWFPQR